MAAWANLMKSDINYEQATLKLTLILFVIVFVMVKNFNSNCVKFFMENCEISQP